ncbi:MAG: hypothetical protein WCA45_08865, partial [Thiobacillaceae bacterium]
AKTIQAITRFSSGLSRRINILADKTLLAAYGDQTHDLSLAHVEAAANDAELARAPSGGKTNWAWVMVGVAAGLGLMAYLAWLGLDKIPALAQASRRLTPATLFAPVSPPADPTPALPPQDLAAEVLPRLGNVALDAFVIRSNATSKAADASGLLKGLANLDISRSLRIFPAASEHAEGRRVAKGRVGKRTPANPTQKDPS